MSDILLKISSLQNTNPQACKGWLLRLFGLKWGSELWYDLLEYDVVTWYNRLPTEDKETLLTHPFSE